MEAQHKRTPVATDEPKKVDPFKNVPEVIEERRYDSQGNPVVLKHVKGDLLGKVWLCIFCLSSLVEHVVAGWLCSSIPQHGSAFEGQVCSEGSCKKQLTEGKSESTTAVGDKHPPGTEPRACRALFALL